MQKISYFQLKLFFELADDADSDATLKPSDLEVFDHAEAATSTTTATTTTAIIS